MCRTLGAGAVGLFLGISGTGCGDDDGVLSGSGSTTVVPDHDETTGDDAAQGDPEDGRTQDDREDESSGDGDSDVQPREALEPGPAAPEGVAVDELIIDADPADAYVIAVVEAEGGSIVDESGGLLLARFPSTGSVEDIVAVRDLLRAAGVDARVNPNDPI